MKKACTLMYYGVAAKLPQPPLPGGRLGNRFRAFLAKVIFLKCGRQVVVRKNAYFGSGSGIEIGDYSEIGLDAYLNRDVTLGSHVLMGQRVTILTTNHEFEDPNVPIHHQGSRERKPVHIGSDVWIGANCIILPGVTIGDGAVIGAGSVVTRCVAPLAVVAGNPARVIRQRGSKLLASRG